MTDAHVATIDRLTNELATKQATVDALLQGYQTAVFPSVPGLAFDVLYRPAAALEHLGGDWYDIFLLPDGRVAFTIGDVCGRGLAAAVKMGQAKQAVKVAASLLINNAMPRAVLEQTNKVIFLNGNNVEFTTALYGIIDMTTRRVTYSSAGHPPPILAQAGTASRTMPNHGFPLGVALESPLPIPEHEFTYEAGQLLVLYTDGLTEYDHDVDAGEASVRRAAREAIESHALHPAKFILEHVLQAPPKHPDDVAVMTIFFQ